MLTRPYPDEPGGTNPDGSSVVVPDPVPTPVATPPPADPKPADQNDAFSPNRTANVLARKTDIEIDATMQELARLRPEIFSEGEPKTPPPPTNGEPPLDPNAGRLAAIERELMINKAALAYGVTADNLDLITGNTQKEIDIKAQKVAALVKGATPAPVTPGDTPPADPAEIVTPPTPVVEIPDTPLPVYSGDTEAPSVAECKQALADSLAEQSWVENMNRTGRP